jgi:hypothetical protein
MAGEDLGELVDAMDDDSKALLVTIARAIKGRNPVPGRSKQDYLAFAVGSIYRAQEAVPYRPDEAMLAIGDAIKLLAFTYDFLDVGKEPENG